MGVHTQPGVVREIPADVIGIVVHHDRIALPKPAIDDAVIPGRDAEIEAAEPEAISVSSLQPEDMAGTEPARETPVLIGAIQMVVSIATAGIVSNPSAVGVNVRRVWMARRVAKLANASRMATLASHWSGTVIGDESTTKASRTSAARMYSAAAVLPATTPLCVEGNGARQRKREKPDDRFHASSFLESVTLW